MKHWLKYLFSLLVLLPLPAQALDILTAHEDTVYNPNIIYTSMPKTYEIAGIKVTGLPDADEYSIISSCGLAVGDRVEMPATPSPGPSSASTAKAFTLVSRSRPRRPWATRYGSRSRSVSFPG